MIVTYGDAIVDLFGLPRGSDVANAEQFVPRQGGAPANVAVVCARLGAPTRFVGAVGRDAHGDRLVGDLRAAGVDTASVVVVPQRTGVTFVRVGLDGARSFLFYRAGGADLSLTAQHIASLAVHPLSSASWLHLTSSAVVAEPKATATRNLLAAAADRGVSLCFDLNVREHLWDSRDRMCAEVRGLAAAATLVKASEEDLVAVGLPATIAGLRSIVSRPGAIGVLTLAERGAVAEIAGVLVEVPAPVVEVVDATGAGDAFMGCLLAWLARHAVQPGDSRWRDPACWAVPLRLACRVGARAVTALGATDGVRDLSVERNEMMRS